MSPILLGGCTRLVGEGGEAIRLEATRVLSSPRATYLRFDIRS